MADSTTIARPYAKAVFGYALSVNKLADWSSALFCLAQAVNIEQAAEFISNPVTTVDQQSDILFAVLRATKSSQLDALENLVRILAENNRLLLLSDIFIQFELLRSEHEKTLKVQVASFSPLTTQQEEELIKRLTKRLQRQVTLDVSIDDSLLGGAIIRAGDMVIDGSARRKLKDLGRVLSA